MLGENKMFFTTEEGVNVIQFGTGDIDVAAGLIDEVDMTIGSLSLSPRSPSKIGTISKRECALDIMFGVHTRMIFTKVESIDIVIKYLQEVRRYMVTDASPPVMVSVRTQAP